MINTGFFINLIKKLLNYWAITEAMKLNLGCGEDIRPGSINLDKERIKGVNVVHNIDKYPWPFKDSYFDEIYASHVIEHVKDIFKAMKEIHRIAKPGATVKIIVPYWHSAGAYSLNHNYYFNTDSLRFFTEKTRSYDSHYYFDMEKIRLKPSKLGKFIIDLKLSPRHGSALSTRHLFSYVFGEVITEIYFELKVVKPQLR